MKNLQDYTISKETAERYVFDWKNNQYTLAPSTLIDPPDGTLNIDSFVFRFADFKEFVNQVANSGQADEITGVICRLGIKPNPTGTIPPMVPCLIFESVLNFDPTADPITAGVAAGDINSVSDRYDFSYPCPPTCPTGTLVRKSGE